jgi:putative molybdopterin biosynthesis protein
MMDTREIAAYLRLKERRIYDLVRSNAIPHLRATGKLLFPRADIDAWLASRSGTRAPAIGLGAGRTRLAAPPVIAGTHDPLLEWAARESASGLAILASGSRIGVERLAQHEATAAVLHWRDDGTGQENLPLIRQLLAAHDVVVLEWAKRVQGLLLARGNPLRISSLRDVTKKKVRVLLRQPEAGSHRLFEHLLGASGIDLATLNVVPRSARAETDLAAAIADGRADAGLGIEAAARAHNLAFIPLTVERLDLVAQRRDAFEPALQALLAFTRTEDFAREAKRLGGYDVSATGRVVFNS